MTLTALRSTGEIFCSLLLYWNFLMKRLELWVLRGKPGGDVPFTSHEIKGAHCHLISHYWWLTLTMKWCFSGYSVKLLFLLLLSRKLYVQPTLKEWGLFFPSLRVDYLLKLFEFFFFFEYILASLHGMWDLSSPTRYRVFSIARQTLSPRTTKEVLNFFFKQIIIFYLFFTKIIFNFFFFGCPGTLLVCSAFASCGNRGYSSFWCEGFSL